MARRLGRWRGDLPTEDEALPELKLLQQLVADGGQGRARRLLAPHLDRLPPEHARLAVALALGPGGRAGGHRLALLLGTHGALARVATVAELRAQVAAEAWQETAEGLRLGLQLDRAHEPAHATALAALLHGLPRTPGELDQLRERARRLGGPRHGHALLDGLAATALWTEAHEQAATLARATRHAESRVGYLDRGARLAVHAGDRAQALALGRRALALSPGPGRALTLLESAEEADLLDVLDELYEEEEPVAAECQAVLELASAQLELALDRAELSDPAALGAPGDALRWVLAALLCWAAPGLELVAAGPLESWLATHCRVLPALCRTTAPEGPRLPGGVAGALLAHQQRTAALKVEAEWCRGAAFGLLVRAVDAAARDRDRYLDVASLAGAWQERAQDAPDVLATVLHDLAGRHPRHRALHRALLSSTALS